MFKPNFKYLVVKDIPLDPAGKTKIRRGTTITRTEGVYYADGIMLGKPLQEDFDRLIEKEQKGGWKYIYPDNPTVGKSNPKK